MAVSKVQTFTREQPRIGAGQQALADLFSTAGGIGTGFLQQGIRQKEQTAADKAKNLRTLLPVLAQMKMLSPAAPGAPGAINLPGVGQFGVTAAQPSVSDNLSRLRAQKLSMEIGATPVTPEFAELKATKEVDDRLFNDFFFQKQVKEDPQLAAKFRKTLIDIGSGKIKPTSEAPEVPKAEDVFKEKKKSAIFEKKRAKPDFVSQEDWDAATNEEKDSLLKALDLGI